MKKLLAIAAVITFLAFNPAPETYIADTKASTIHWLGKKATGQHDGFVGLKSGKLVTQNGVPQSGEFVIDMNALTCTDIKDPESNKGLIEHFKNEDFFNVASFPEARLTISKFTAIDKPEKAASNYTATAQLTIKGITNDITFPVSFNATKNGQGKANATITIDRTKWNIVYKSKSVFSTLGDKFIYDDITFDVSLSLEQVVKSDK